MGAVLGGLIGGIGNLVGGNQQRQADKQAAKTALTGFNYLTNPNTGIGSEVQQGNQAGTDISALLTGGPNSGVAKSAFGNYLNSTGYQFQLGQGTAAINSNMAARGLLQSGGTAKALAEFGQGLSGQYFNNYLNQLSGVQSRGLQASGQIGQAGNVGGANAAGYNQAGGQAASGSINGAIGSFTNILGAV